MRTFQSLEEMKPFYNENTDTYEFVEDGELLDVEFTFDFVVNSSIQARNIRSWDINAQDIHARDINAYDISAMSINARNILYYAVCFAYQDITCEKIKGIRRNAKHFALDGKVEIIKEKTKEA